MVGGTSGTSPCASCKLLRRRCVKDCIFAPFFPSDDPNKFAVVHKVFGASNVSKMLQEIPFNQRADAVSSLVFEARVRLQDPVYGCVRHISYLQNQVSQLQMQLAVAQAEISLHFQMQQEPHQQIIDFDHDHDMPVLTQHDSFSMDSMSHVHQLMSFASSRNVVEQEPDIKSESGFN